MANVYEMVTERITAQLQQGNIPWRRPWTGTAAEDGGAINYVSRYPYSLLNQLMLGKPGEYLTWKQIEDLGGKVKKGAKASMVVFFTRLTIKEKPGTQAPATTQGDDKKEEEKTIPLLRYYNVFHLDDVEGIPSKIKPGAVRTVQPIEAAEKVIGDYLARQPKLGFHNDQPSNRAYYSPSRDEVVVPMLSQYEIPEEYYSTTFHELTHSTIPASRCDRVQENQDAHFGNHEYSREELVAEIGSAMLCNRVGIECDKAFKNSVAYIKGWLKALNNDPKMIVWDAGRAEKAAKFILNEF